MNKSESIANLATALCQFQAEISNPKNTANNPFFKSKYAPLNDVLNLVRPILSKHGLSIFQSPSGNGDSIIITTMLMHNSGEWIEADPLVLKADKATAQGAGSSITYGRRYALSAILGIASEEDDDGNHASGNNESKQHKTEQKKTLSKDMIAELEALRVRAMQTEAEFFANLEKMCKTKVVTYDDLSGIKNLDQVISTIDKALSKKQLKEGAK